MLNLLYVKSRASSKSAMYSGYTTEINSVLIQKGISEQRKHQLTLYQNKMFKII